jgi:putative transcriptional regulator
MSLAGSFLVAQSSLSDPNFLQSVVLILAHNEGGAFGLVVNRLAKKDGLPFPVFDGGPCPAPGLFMLHGHADWVAASDDGESETEDEDEDDDEGENEAEHEGDGEGESNEEGPPREVAPGIYLGDPACLKRASQPGDGQSIRFRAFQGYAGWGPGQLEHELDAGAWQVTAADSELLFETPVETLWRLLAPPRIPRPSAN